MRPAYRIPTYNKDAMSKEEAIQFEGEVVETLPNTTFRVKTQDRSMSLRPIISGKMRKNLHSNLERAIKSRWEMDPVTT